MIPSQVDDTLQNPFLEDVFGGELDAEATYAPLYASAQDDLRSVAARLERRSPRLRSPLGLTILLNSPHAGSGKSHFLARAIHEARGLAHGCRLDFETEDPLSWNAWFRSLLKSFHEAPDARSGHTALTGQVSYLFAEATSKLISEGAVPCDSPATASRWLDENSRRLFDPAETENPSVAWFQREFKALLPSITRHYASTLSVDPNEITSWLEWLYHYASAAQSSHVVSDRRARQGACLRTSPFFSRAEDGTARDGLRAFGRLMTQEAPLLWMLDGLDWLYHDEAAARKLARMISEFRSLIPSSATIISVNEDLWRETFVAGLPEAIRDRLTSQVITLNGVPSSEWEAFLTCRAQADVSNLQAHVARIAATLRGQAGAGSRMMPRRLIRLASRLWSGKGDEISTNREDESGATRGEGDRGGRASHGPSLPNGDAVAETAEPEVAWRHALGDVQQFIQGRAEHPHRGNGRRLRPPIWSRSYPAEKANVATPRDASPDPHREGGSPADPLSPRETPPPPTDHEASPALSHEFKSFLARLRSRAEPKEDYLPSALPEPAGDPIDERTMIRNSLILHGKKPEIIADERNPQAEIVPAQPAEAPPWILARLQALTAEIDQSEALRSVDPEKLQKIVELAGRSFPAVLQERIFLDEHPEQEVLRWRFQQCEVHLGFAAAKDRRFWPALLEYTAARARELREREKTRVKLVVFAHINDTGIFESWNAGGTENAVHRQFCDAVFLTRSQLRNLYAQAALLEEQETDARRQDVFLQTSGQLDFFWKMITRPVWTSLRPNLRHD